MRIHQTRRDDKALRPLCAGTGKVLRTNFLPTDADLTCPGCLRYHRSRAQYHAALDAARRRVDARTATS